MMKLARLPVKRQPDGKYYLKLSNRFSKKKKKSFFVTFFPNRYDGFGKVASKKADT